MLSQRFASALEYAFEIHRGQTRKGGETPYLSHLLAVAALVLEDGGSEGEAIAALLHDAAEDQGGRARLTDIEVRFGGAVAAVVEACSDTLSEPKEEWRARKQAFLERLSQAPVEVVRVSLADKVHNLRSMVDDYARAGEALWERFNPASDPLWYHRELLAIYRSRTSSPLVAALERALVNLESALASAAHPTPASYWVVPGRLLAGPYPADPYPADPYPADPDTVHTARTLRRLRWAGVRAFVDLTAEGEHRLPAYAPLLDEGCEHRRLEIGDRTAPAPARMSEILDHLDAALAPGGAVYLHCAGGLGRTGTVAGCYLVRQGVPAEEALARLRALRDGSRDAHLDSPETDEQRRLVRAWSEGRGSGKL